MIWDRISASVRVAAGKARLGFLTVPMFVILWPDWQLTSLYTRGFKVAGLVEPSNIYPKVDCKGESALHHLLEFGEAETWNLTLAEDTKAFDHDKDVWDTCQDQRKRHLLFRSFDKNKRRCHLREGQMARNLPPRNLAERESSRY